MTVKEFFKGKSFKCIAALLCVLLISGIFLTVMNSLLYVSETEKDARAINKIYGKSVTTQEIKEIENYSSNATIDRALKVTNDGNYLIKATGKGGFDNGTVTCWVVVGVSNGSVKGIEKVVILSNKGQSYIANINDKFMQGFYGDYENGNYFNPNEGFIKTGATRSATAICNAVNGALDFVNAKLGNVAQDVYENCLYKENIDTKQTTHTATADGVIFEIQTNGGKDAGGFTVTVTVDKNGVITDYVITVNGSTSDFYRSKMSAEVLDGSLFKNKDLAGILAILGGTEVAFPSSGSVISTGATQSNYLCVCAAAFAAANYEQFLVTADGGNGGENENNNEGGNA